MARPLRIEFPGAFYHVTACGNERQPIYRDHADRRGFLAILAEAVDLFHLLVHAYVLMDNHYHLPVETLEANLARAMRKLDGDYAQHFNRTHRRVGDLFQARYKALPVDRDSYLVELSRYIHLNPVRAGLVVHADHYGWSSARVYVGRARAPAFLTIADVLGHFARTTRQAQRRYRQFLGEGEAGSPAGSPLDKVVGQVLLGDEDWVRAMRRRIDGWLAAGRVDLKGSTEVPAARSLRVRPTLDHVIDAVARAMQVNREAICSRRSRSTARALAMYWRTAPVGCRRKKSGRPLRSGE